MKRRGAHLKLLSVHDALLLRHSFALPKLLYCLRTAPCLLSSCVQEYDEVLKSIVSEITNVHFGDRSASWIQATLPVKLGGLGIRRAEEIAPCAYLASTAASSQLVSSIVPCRLIDFSFPNLEDAQALWAAGHNESPPEGDARKQQKVWDSIKAKSIANNLLENAPDPRARARLLASASYESGVWLNVLPVSSLGLRMDDDTIRVAVGLRLGTSLCNPHICRQCGAEVDILGTHGLSCSRSQGRHFRHAALNDIVHQSLTSARVPARLEPIGLQRNDGKRPDGVTMVPWSFGRQLVWDVTTPNTFAPSYIVNATSEAEAVAALAEERKKAKY